jgi:hypothetical protein
MVLETDSLSGLDRKVLKRILLDAGGSLSLAELKEKVGKVIPPQRTASHSILKACDFVNRVISVELPIGSQRDALLPFSNRLPDRSIFIAVVSEHSSICEVKYPHIDSPQRLDPFDTCKIRLRFKGLFKQELRAHCDIVIRDVPSGRLVERIRFDISIHN